MYYPAYVYNAFIIIPLISFFIGLIPILIFRPRLSIFVLGLIAYFTAIGLKYLVQYVILPYQHVLDLPAYIVGTYFGAQTAVFEVGLAFLFIYIYKKVEIKDAMSYGVTLAFAENGIMVGIVSLISGIINMALLPYYPPLMRSLVLSEASIPYIYDLYHTMDRISSFLLHTAWGSSAVLYYITKEKLYLLVFIAGFLADFLAGLYIVKSINYLLLALLALSIGIISFIPVYVSLRHKTKNQ